MTVHVKDAGVWKNATPYVKNGGVWAEASQVWTRDSGLWKKCYQADIVPPTVPTLTVSVVESRYINVTIKPDTTPQADLDLVRVLVNEKGGYPPNQYASGYVTTPDNTYSFEPWSDFLYNQDSGLEHPDTTLPITKEYPPNPTTSTALAGGKPVYIAAWAKDKKGNWSAGAFVTVNIPVRPTNPPIQIPTTHVTTYDATYSSTYRGTDGALRWSGHDLHQGYFDDNNGMEKFLTFFNYQQIMRDLNGATLVKAEFYLYNHFWYDPTVGGWVRWRYHSDVTPAGNINLASAIGNFNQNGDDEPNWPQNASRWVDISTGNMNQWKSGVYKGMRFEPGGVNRIYTGSFDGHLQAHPPKLRFTYTK